jgi:hypothetical protein
MCIQLDATVYTSVGIWILFCCTVNGELRAPGEGVRVQRGGVMFRIFLDNVVIVKLVVRQTTKDCNCGNASQSGRSFRFGLLPEVPLEYASVF